MNIVYDGRWLGRTGIGRYTAELLDQLQEQDHTNHYQVLLLPDQFAAWKPRNPNFHPVRTTYEVYSWQEQLLLPWQLFWLRPTLVHFTSFNLPMLYGGRFVVTVHDLTLVHYKNARGQGFKKLVYELKYHLMRRVLKSAVKRAQTVIVPVKYVRDDLAKLFRGVKNKTVVTYEAVNANFATTEPITKFNLPNMFVLYVGTYYPYKNIGRLVEAFAKTRARQKGVKLVLAGAADDFQRRLRQRVEELGLVDEVIFTGRVSDGELASLYQQASLYAFPSLSEGFGLPGLEAMIHGIPVAAARASCLPEVYGDAAVYFDPYDTGDMAQTIDNTLGDKEQRLKLRDAGLARVKQFSWAKMTTETLAVYEAAQPTPKPQA